MGPPRDLAIRPLGVSEIVERSVALTLRHFRPLFLAMLVVEAPAFALARTQSGAILELLAAAADPVRAAPRLAEAGRSFAGLFVLLLALQLLGTAAAAAIVARSLDPRTAPPAPPGRRRAAAALTATALQLALLLAAPLLGAAPGLMLAVRARSPATVAAGVAGAVVGGLVLLLWAVLRLLLAPAVAAVEGIGGLAALRRSARLMAARTGASLAERPGLRASLALFACFLLAVAVNGLSSLPRAMAARLTGDPAAALLGAGLPLGVELVLSVIEVAAGAAVQPVGLVAVAVLYFERRARTEGLDLEPLADRLEAGR